jgi:hypothetical protein
MEKPNECHAFLCVREVKINFKVRHFSVLPFSGKELLYFKVSRVLPFVTLIKKAKI